MIDRLYVVEVKLGLPLQNVAYVISKSDDPLYLKEHLEDRFGLHGKEYEVFVHEFPIKEIEENHLSLIPYYFDSIKLDLKGDVEFLDRD